METVKIMDFENERFDTGIKIDEVDRVEVVVVTGDEILMIWMKDGSSISTDVDEDYSHKHRGIDFYDGHYTVKSEDLLKWNNRKTSYSYFSEV